MAGALFGAPKPPAPIAPPPPPTIADAATFTRGAGSDAGIGSMGKTLMTGGQGITAKGNTATKTLLGQ
jgi:hypothetical protein